MKGLVVLFDLDGTALTFEGSSPGPGRTALERTMRELFGTDDATAGIRVAGGTDRAIVRAMLANAGLATDEATTQAVLDGYVAHLERVLLTRRYRAVGSVAQTVDALQSRGATVGVATGNTRAGARVKLTSAGLDSVFDLNRGAYGCEFENRNELVQMAAARCGAGAKTQVVVVGDTDRDVTAARSLGPRARVVGVAINAMAETELQGAGADAIVYGCGEPLLAAIVHLHAK